MYFLLSISKKNCKNRDCFNKGIIILADLGFFKHSIRYRSGYNGEKYFLKKHTHFHVPQFFVQEGMGIFGDMNLPT